MPENVIIIGSGPAGLTAALYAGRANLNPLMIEGAAPYGQLMLTTDVENYPGFPDGILGPELMESFRKQAEKFGARFITADASRVDFSRTPFVVEVGETSYEANSIIVSTGAKARMLDIPGERELLGRGVSTCATCDGFFFRGRELVVVGGGDSAVEEAIFLTKFATKVTIIHRRDELRASKIMQDRARANEKISFLWNTVVDEVAGSDGAVTGLKLKNVKTGEVSDFKTDGLFIAIGHDPNTQLFKGQLELDDNGYIVAQHPRTQTSVAGVFACGDVVDHIYRQAITAAGTGCAAAIDAERFLEALAHKS
ncbi:MAG TPA: thioredoxin-disulfide reductase [Actinomycetota bacterium]|nr:thioredoxin-disulfide reductase [Actinomycetota bacterium]